MRTKDVDDTAQTKSCEGNCRQDRPKEISPPGGIPVHYGGSELFDPLFFFNVPIESGLKCGLHPLLVVLFELHEPKRLMTPRKRSQHFCCPRHRSPVSPEHQLDNGTLIKELR